MKKLQQFNLKPLYQLIGAGLLSIIMLDANAETGNPRVNQIGYLPNGAKIASYKTTSTNAQTWQLKQNGAVVASGQTVPSGTDAASGDNLQQIDLSSVTATGSGFTITVGSDTSYAFNISATAFRAAFYDSLRYFYHNRSGIAISTQYTGGGNGSYAANSKWARPAGHLNIGANKGDVNTPCWTGTCNYSLNVSKGWYDAGDHGKYVVNGGISVWTLLNMYERGLYFTGNAAAMGDGKLNIPESANGIPDILDEVRWEMEFLLSMQVPTGQAKAGMVHHKMHDVGWTGFPLSPSDDPQQRALVPPSTAATLNLAATAAQSARIWKDLDAGFSATCLAAAKSAWDAAQANPADIYSGNYDNGGGGYGDKTVSDDFYWAAAELYITTGDAKYLPTINNFTITRTDFSWADTELAGLASLATVPVAQTANLTAAAQQKIITLANTHLATQNASGYSAPLSTLEYYWGSNSGVTNKLILMGLAYDFTKNDSYAKGVVKGVDYLLGRNTLSTSFVTGEGTKTVTQPHHRFWSNAINGSYPVAPPGALSGGPNSSLDDTTSAAQLASCTSKPATCWIDNINAYAVNEITINWNAPLAWLLSFNNDYTGGGTSVSSSSAASSKPASSTPASSKSASSTPASSTPASSTPISSKPASSIPASSIPASSIPASSIPASSRPASSVAASTCSSTSQCNWYGTRYPTCVSTTSGWGYENGKSCIAATTCTSQPSPYGLVSTANCATSSIAASSKPASSKPASSAPASSKPASSIAASSKASSSIATGKNCTYVVSNEWNTGFSGLIRIKNNGTTAINGWNVSWNYTDGSKMTSSYNATVTGSGPYNASNLSWNSSIQPGQSVEFGFQGTKGSSTTAQVPTVTGAVCQ